MPQDKNVTDTRALHRPFVCTETAEHPETGDMVCISQKVVYALGPAEAKLIYGDLHSYVDGHHYEFALAG